jgi:GTPase SAR1 family protein
MYHINRAWKYDMSDGMMARLDLGWRAFPSSSLALMESDIESGLGAHPLGASLPLALLLANPPGGIPRRRILVIGDSGVGASALTHRLSGVLPHQIRANAQLAGSTVGCQTECKLYAHKSAVAASSVRGSSVRSYAAPVASSGPALHYLELLDVSGHRRYLASRDVFYSALDGVIFVFDLMNRASYENVANWRREIAAHMRAEHRIRDQTQNAHSGSIGGEYAPGSAARTDRSRTSSSTSSPHASPVLRAGSPSESPPTIGLTSALAGLPMLIVGNKLDEYASRQMEQGSYEAQTDFGVDSVYLVRHAACALSRRYSCTCRS